MLTRRLLTFLLNGGFHPGRFTSTRVCKPFFKRFHSLTQQSRFQQSKLASLNSSDRDYSASERSSNEVKSSKSRYSVVPPSPASKRSSRQAKPSTHSEDSASARADVVHEYSFTTQSEELLRSSSAELFDAFPDFDDGTNTANNLHPSTDSTHGSHEFCEVEVSFHEEPKSSELFEFVEHQRQQQINEFLFKMRFEQLERQLKMEMKEAQFVEVELQIKRKEEDEERIEPEAPVDDGHGGGSSGGFRAKYVALASMVGMFGSDEETAAAEADSTLSSGGSGIYFSPFYHRRLPFNQLRLASAEGEKFRSSQSTGSATYFRRPSYGDSTSPTSSSDENATEPYSFRSTSPLSTTSSGSSGSTSPVASSGRIPTRVMSGLLDQMRFTPDWKSRTIHFSAAPFRASAVFAQSNPNKTAKEGRTFSFTEVQSKSESENSFERNAETWDFTELAAKVDKLGRLILRPSDLRDPVDWRRLEAFLISSPQVSSLRFQGVNILQPFAVLLNRGALKQVRSVYFCDNNLGVNEGALEVIIRALMQCNQLEIAAILRNSLNDSHAVKLAEMLSVHPTLQSLSLCWNGIHTTGAQKFAAVLRALGPLSPLKKLDLSYNRLGSKGIAMLNDAQRKLHSAGKEISIDLGHNSSQKILAPTLQAHKPNSLNPFFGGSARLQWPGLRAVNVGTLWDSKSSGHSEPSISILRNMGTSKDLANLKP